MNTITKNLYKLLILITISIQAKEITVGSYNVENLFDLKTTGNEYKIYKKGNSNWNIITYHKKLNNIAKVITALNCDILALQEIESENALKDLLNQKGLKELGYSIIWGGDSSKSSVFNAIITKYPKISSKVHPVKLRATITRPILEAQIAIGENKLTLFVVHFPSKRKKESYRVEVAKILMKRVKKLPKKSEYLILGDFNSDHDEAQNLLTSDMDNSNGVTGINHILKTLKNNIGEPVNYVSPKNIESYEHFNPWWRVKPNKQFSYIYRGELNTIDNILIPKTLLDSVGLKYKSGSFQNFTMNGMLLKGKTPYRWQKTWGKGGQVHQGRGFSDHLPIMLSLTTEKQSYEHIEVKKGSFEQTSQGWLSNGANWTLIRTKKQSLDGDWSLSISGKSNKSETVAKNISIIISKKPNFFIGGQGNIYVRYRKLGSKKWIKDKIGKGRSSYWDLSNSWHKIEISPSINIGDTLELEIRSKAKSYLNIFIDNFYLDGSLRI